MGAGHLLVKSYGIQEHWLLGLTMMQKEMMWAAYIPLSRVKSAADILAHVLM